MEHVREAAGPSEVLDMNRERARWDQRRTSTVQWPLRDKR